MCTQPSHREFQTTNGATDHTSPHALGEWLVSRNIFSRYQVTVLLAGRPGPFVYGDYKIYDRVEAGRLANEFRAVHAGVGHPVLLRFLAGPVVQDQRLWMSAATEAQIACCVSHPNLQRFFELVDLGSFKFLVEEDLHGETLAERLSVGRLPSQEACRVARMLAQGMAALWAQAARGFVPPVPPADDPPRAAAAAAAFGTGDAAGDGLALLLGRLDALERRIGELERAAGRPAPRRRGPAAG